MQSERRSGWAVGARGRAMPDYGNPHFWDERYAARGDGECFDWYQDWTTLGPLIRPYLTDPVSCEILIPGCGNSRLGVELYDQGYKNITAVDTSDVVISLMADRFKDRDQMEFASMDAKNLAGIPDGTFDVIIDKALLDALLCSDDNIISVNHLVREMHRVLKPGGVYLVVSHGAPDTRVGYLRRPAQGLSWVVDTVVCQKPSVEGLEEPPGHQSHYLYACHKS